MADHIAKFKGIIIRTRADMNLLEVPIKSNQNHAFTLIELLVVIAIIAMLENPRGSKTQGGQALIFAIPA